MFCANEIASISVCQRRGVFEDLLCVAMNREVGGGRDLFRGSMPTGCVLSNPGSREGLDVSNLGGIDTLCALPNVVCFKKAVKLVTGLEAEQSASLVGG
jgi:hypothetical protein